MPKPDNSANGTDDKSKDNRARFVKYAQTRTSGAIKALRNLGKLANTKQYEYSETDIQAIEKAVRDQTETTLSTLRDGLKGKAVEVESEFTLPNA